MARGPIAPVDVIVGPGNAYVAEAKRQVFGQVGIDSIAGPSEILVVADGKNDPDWIAADLLSQAEHDPTSQSILITDDDGFATGVAAAAEAQLKENPRHNIASAAWKNNSAIIVVGALRDAPALVNALAPEHLELAVDDPEDLLADIRHAGAIFLGRYAPEAVGRLCRRAQPRIADGARCALRVRSFSARLHEAFVDHRLQRGGASENRPCRRAAC